MPDTDISITRSPELGKATLTGKTVIGRTWIRSNMKGVTSAESTAIAYVEAIELPGLKRQMRSAKVGYYDTGGDAE